MAVPERTELRRALTPGPIVQQSPNGLYQLSITDGGIELHGPKGTVRINDHGIQIGGPGTMQINIQSGDVVRLRGARDAQFLSGRTMTLQADGDVQVSGTNMQLTGSAAGKISGAGPSSVTAPLLSLGCTSGRMAARQGDQVVTGGGPQGIIQVGSPRVLIC